MIDDARTLDDGAVLGADLCIVGAGAAGITLALRLIDSGLSVLVLESGGYDIEPDTQALYEGRMSGIDTWSLDKHRWRLFGGSTARWAGWCRPLNPDDFAVRDFIPMSGWPISFDDLVEPYRRAHERVEIGAFDYDVERATVGSPLLPSPSGRLETRIFRYSPPTRFGTRYRAALRDAENVQVYLHANAVELQVDGSGQRVQRLAGRVLDGPSFTVEAARYVLAMGGLENARLLLASRSRREEGVANSSGLVGRCFMEHPHLYGGAIWLAGGDPLVDFYKQHVGPDGVPIRGVLALTREVRESEGLLDVTLSIDGSGLDDAETGDVPPSDVAALVHRDPLLWKLTLRAEQAPWTESRVTLTDDTDALGMPRLALHWAVHPDDLRSYRKTVSILGRELARAGLGRTWSPRDDDGLFDWKLDPGGHHMGTTRMSADPAEGVVDRDCRCHDVENLYIAGSSVFTTGGSANPTLTVIALAERLADHLLEGA
jgi:choline dehydrogenase-like flavoprotein